MCGGGVLLNKVLSIVLILIILIIPFQTLLNVKAEGVVITTDETTLEENSGFKHVTNTTSFNVIADHGDIDSYSAYKILDVYYNETTNEMTYGFTTDFKSFIDQLPSGDDFYNLTIEKYQELTSDESRGEVTTTSTLNKLVSKYATYLKKTTNSPTSLVLITKQTDREYKRDLEVGSYLIIPTNPKPNIYHGLLRLKTFGVVVANVDFRISNGNWELNGSSSYLKFVYNGIAAAIFNETLDKFIQEPEIIYNLTYSATKELYFMSEYHYDSKLPTNTHSSILNNSTIMDKIGKLEIIFPKGLTYDLNDIYFLPQDENDNLNVVKAIIKDNSMYYNNGTEEVRYADFTQNTDTNSIVLSNTIEWNDLLFKLKTNDNTKLGTTTNADLLANYGNVITTNSYYLKDAYVDISGMSQEEAEAAVLGVGTLTNTVYTYGVKVTNKDNSTLLNGAKFQVCLDKDCNTKVGEEFEITENGTYTFKGLNDTDTYYLKQTKATSGYKVADPVELKPTSLNKETGFYDVEVTSKKMGLLPSTGGLGTILYTTFGLLIIVVGSIFFISYRKRQVNVNN